MSKKGRAKKANLITAVIMSVFVVSSASVSTFAWFQAQANVNIQTATDSATITVNKPEDYAFYAYKGNTLSTWGGKGTFGNDFVPLTTAALVTQYTTFTAMKPGDIYVFAIKVSTASSASLVLNDIISNNATKQNILDADENVQERYVYNTDSYKLNIGYAMDIFVSTYTPTSGSEPTGYGTFVTATTGDDLFKFDVSKATDRTVLDTGSYASPTIDLSAVSSDITFFSSNSLDSRNDLYIMWSVYYSDSILYDEVSAGSATVLKEEPSTGDRYFKASPTGTSNCFGGLKFALTAFTLTIDGSVAS